MQADILTGQLVHLTAEEPAVFAEAFNRWNRDSYYYRLLSTDTAAQPSRKLIQDWLEKDILIPEPKYLMFGIRTLSDNRLVGEIGLEGIQLPRKDTFVGIGIGDREDWGKGYGTDAMRIMLRYAFIELNLERVSLDVFEYNPRAVRSYEKAGFTHEGRLRQLFQRDGRRWDLTFMGITRAEWEQLNRQAAA
jgi:RimJ/RimL family protein N-acetyltransferase